MREFEKVAVPPVYPQKCVCCDSSTGPMADTQRELRGWGRVYVCVSCWEGVGRALGTLKGKERNGLLQIARQAAEGETEIGNLRALLAEQRGANGSLETERDRLAELYSVATGRIQQLESRLADEARAMLELVGVAE